MSPRPFSNHPTLIEIRAKKARHLELVEEVKLEMQGKQPTKQPQIHPDRNTVTSPAGFAMTIKLDTDTKPILKNAKD